MKVKEIYIKAGLSESEKQHMPKYISGELEFYGSSAYEKLYEYFAFEICEMPYGTAKADDGEPDEWILERIS